VSRKTSVFARVFLQCFGRFDTIFCWIFRINTRDIGREKFLSSNRFSTIFQHPAPFERTLDGLAPYTTPMAEAELMQCMEVWGGNEPVDSSVAMAAFDAWVYCRPFTGQAAVPAPAGGDVYYVSSCATGRITRLLVADVSGHGTAVRDPADALRHLMRKYVNYLDPRRFVKEMNRQFAELSSAGLFATAIVTTFFSPTNQLTFCNAGHPPPLLYRAGRGWAYIDVNRPNGPLPTDLPLGILESADYQQFDVRLEAGDLVLCYTDGLPESRRSDGDFLGQEGLLEVLQNIRLSEPSRLVPDLLGAIAALREGNLFGDDITVLLFRPKGNGLKASFGNRFLAPLRLGSALIASLFPHGGPAPWPDFHLANVGGAVFSGFNRMWKGSNK